MPSAVAMSAQARWSLGRRTEVTEVVINDAGATEGQNDVIRPAQQLVPSSCLTWVILGELGKLVSNEHLLSTLMHAKLLAI